MPFLCCFWTILDSGFVLFPCSVSTRKQLPSCWEQLVNILHSWRKPRLTVAPWTLWWCAWKILTLESRRLQPGRLHILQGIMQVLWHVWKEGDSSLGLFDKNSFVYCKQSFKGVAGHHERAVWKESHTVWIKYLQNTFTFESNRREIWRRCVVWPSGTGNGALPVIPTLKQVPPTLVTQQDTVSRPNQTKPDKTKQNSSAKQPDNYFLGSWSDNAAFVVVILWARAPSRQGIPSQSSGPLHEWMTNEWCEKME